MAGDWIKMRCNLLDDPAVLAISAAVGLDEYAVTGRLLKLWSWADQQTTDGNARGVTNVTARVWLDRYLSCPGLADALVAVGWLEIDESGMRIPNFDRHNGKSGKQRAVTSKRVKKHREQCNAETVTQIVTSDVTPTVTKPLPEKRRVLQEGNTKTSLPSKPSPQVSKARSGSGKGIDEKDLNDAGECLRCAAANGVNVASYENRLNVLKASLHAKSGDSPGGLFVSVVKDGATGRWDIPDEHHEPAKRWLRSFDVAKRPASAIVPTDATDIGSLVDSVLANGRAAT